MLTSEKDNDRNALLSAEQLPPGCQPHNYKELQPNHPWPTHCFRPPNAFCTELRTKLCNSFFRRALISLPWNSNWISRSALRFLYIYNFDLLMLELFLAASIFFPCWNVLFIMLSFQILLFYIISLIFLLSQLYFSFLLFFTAQLLAKTKKMFVIN